MGQSTVLFGMLFLLIQLLQLCPTSSTVTKTCSGTLTATTEVQQVASRNYPNTYYGDDDECRIYAPPGKQVRLSLVTFTMEYTNESCLIVYDGTSSNYPGLGRYSDRAGRNTVLESSSGSLYLSMTTDGFGTRQGFLAEYSITDTNTCNRTLTATTEVKQVASRYYPRDYRSNDQCWYQINAPPGLQVQLSFVTFSTQSGYDYLNVYDGTSSSDPRLGRYSGKVNSDTVLVSTSGSLYLYMTSDSSASKPGFLADYSIVEFIRVPTSGCSASSSEDPGGSCSKALDGDMNSDFATNGEGVGAWIEIIFPGTFGVTSMQISNRANGHSPREELNKDVQLTFSDGYTTHVTLGGVAKIGKLESFTFKQVIWARSVNITTLTVYSAHNNGYAEIVFCGNVSVPYTNTCHNTLTATAEVKQVASRNYPYSYRNKDRCWYRINAPPRQQVQLSFVEFSSEICFDCLEVYDGTAISDPLLGCYCGTVNSDTVLVSTSGSLFLYMTTVGSSRLGFLANYSIAEGKPPNETPWISRLPGKEPITEPNVKNTVIGVVVSVVIIIICVGGVYAYRKCKGRFPAWLQSANWRESLHPASTSNLQRSTGGVEGPGAEIKMGAMCSGINGDGKPRHENEYEVGDVEDVYHDIDDVTDGYEDPSKIENAAND